MCAQEWPVLSCVHRVPRRLSWDGPLRVGAVVSVGDSGETGGALGLEICGPAGATARWGLLVRSDGASPALLAAHRDSAALAPARSMGLGGSGVWAVGPVPPPVASVDPLGMALCSFPQGPRGPLDSGPKYKHGAVTVALR